MRAPKAMYGMVFGIQFHNGTLIGPSGSGIAMMVSSRYFLFGHLDPEAKKLFDKVARCLLPAGQVSE